METIEHPDAQDLQLSRVMAALSDPLRLAIVRRLAELGEMPCSGVSDMAAKSKLSYHYRILREAGVTRTRIVGTARLLSLRRDDLDARFPGLLDVVLRAPVEAAEVP